MMLPPKVSRSTIAAHSRGSVKVLVQPENDSLEVADPEPGHGGLGAQGDQQVGLAGAGVADQAQRQAFFDPVTGGEGVDDRRAEAGVGVEVEGAQRFFPGESGGLDPPERRRARSSHSAISSSARKAR
jgi:hypothetical protein